MIYYVYEDHVLVILVDNSRFPSSSNCMTETKPTCNVPSYYKANTILQQTLRHEVMNITLSLHQLQFYSFGTRKGPLSSRTIRCWRTRDHCYRNWASNTDPLRKVRWIGSATRGLRPCDVKPSLHPRDASQKIALPMAARSCVLWFTLVTIRLVEENPTINTVSVNIMRGVSCLWELQLYSLKFDHCWISQTNDE